ncbi:MAG: toll/interleukin-1 receptor domain-containing protein [Thermodesulfobacteriota bacterium]|nr:toll/interleukin-1 receptor domain-containing protein [Thermodesulfobacteriota bacterium]
MDKNEIVNSLRIFKNRRDDLLHEDSASFEHHLDRFVKFCQKDLLIKKIMQPLSTTYETDIDSWMKAINEGDGKIQFPEDPEEELVLRFRILEKATGDFNYIFKLGLALGGEKRDGWIEVFRSVVIRPFVDEISHRLGDAADLASPDARALQAIPLDRIPSTNQIKIFLSHKSTDKPLVYRYYNALKEIGYNPWLDEPAMTAGSNLEREILKGFQESCAAVFFITDDFKDEKYLAAEIDYAVMQKRQKGNKFSIITLRYSDAAPVPDLLTPYIYKNINNDLEGFFEIVRALPIELGPVRWKDSAID